MPDFSKLGRQRISAGLSQLCEALSKQWGIAFFGVAIAVGSLDEAIQFFLGKIFSRLAGAIL